MSVRRAGKVLGKLTEHKSPKGQTRYPMFNQESLIEAGFQYNQTTGVITKNGKQVGYNGNGYVVINVDGKGVTATKVIWALLGVEVPEGYCTDHINGVKNDNRIENLRIVTFRQNSQNLAKHRNGKLLGTSFRNGHYRSQIRIDNKVVELGLFATEIEASEAYWAAVENLHRHRTNATFRAKVLLDMADDMGNEALAQKAVETLQRASKGV